MEDISELSVYLSSQSKPWFVLGGGSNVLFAEQTTGIVIHPQWNGIDYHDQSEKTIDVTVAAGENWHVLVCETLDKGFTGLENLSLIPGSVGAAPIQNIGAYGVELCQRFVCLKAFDLHENEWRVFDKAECDFSYRDSVFKRQLIKCIFTNDGIFKKTTRIT